MQAHCVLSCIYSHVCVFCFNPFVPPQVASHGRALSLQGVRASSRHGVLACPHPLRPSWGTPLLSGCEPFSPFGVPPFLRRTFLYLAPCAEKECLRSRFPCQVLMRDSSCLRAPGIRIASACARGVIRVPLTVELQLEAQTFPFLPISGP